MLSKEEIETCKEEARNFIEFMETAGDNAGWTRGLMWYIEQLESREQKLIGKLEEIMKETAQNINTEIMKKYQNVNMEEIDDETYILLAMHRIGFAGEILEFIKSK